MRVTLARHALFGARLPVRRLLTALVLACAVLLGGLGGPAGATRAADLFTELRTFPGVVLLPPPELEPFATLEPWRVELNRPRPGSTSVVRGRYLVQYRDRAGGTGSAQVGGTIGRDELDQTLSAMASRSFRRCPADAPYCTENVAGQDGAPLASELFRGVQVGDSEAVVEHVVCCGGHYWSLTWYDAPRDSTYTLVLVGPVADLYGTSIAQENVVAAERIAGIAARLTPLE
ncbi:MAG: hypothetical protein IT306_20315 [Chloroflexi bacterium]|nr:hypothetical protein [Chloroflexota bacterium]